MIENPVSNDIDLDRYSFEQLQSLLTKVKEALKKKGQDEITEIGTKLEAISKSLDIPVEALLAPYQSKSYPPSRIKFRNPDNPEQVWVGRGQKPAWYREKLASGVTPEMMKVV